MFNTHGFFIVCNLFIAIWNLQISPYYLRYFQFAKSSRNGKNKIYTYVSCRVQTFGPSRIVYPVGKIVNKITANKISIFLYINNLNLFLAKDCKYLF